jgi:Omp85 superfamily domain/Calcineurin-like phosphoesterase
MKSYLTYFLILFGFIHSVKAQDGVQHRIIFIGDAGEINPFQQTIAKIASEKIVKDKTTVVYLGDNIYPNGMGLDSISRQKTEQILQAQFAPMRAKNATVYFIPGNHDWDRMGKLGLQKIKAQWQYIQAQNDSLLQLVPKNGCPDPTEIHISEGVVIIAIDSEWWLFPHDKTNPDANCECDSKKEIIEKLEALFYKNRHKQILLASHHPFQSNGVHGGHFVLKDHLFPLTAASPNLYIPLPVIGSLYPLLRSTVLLNPEDLRHPDYQNMIKQIDHVFEGFPNLTHVAGHEHGLQLIGNKNLQIVSGSGAKNTPIPSKKDSPFRTSKSGFVMVDVMKDHRLVFTFHAIENKELKPLYTYEKPLKSISNKSQVFDNQDDKDSLMVQANARYNQVGEWHRKLFGENYRQEWATPAKLPFIKISTIFGGLTPLQRGGGMQSNSLRLKDKSGKEWVIRSVNKNPDALLPDALRETFARNLLDDATSSQHPYSALIVPPIAQALKIPHSNPVIGIIAPDSALGIFGKVFENTLCLLEEREPLGKSDNSEKMLSNLQTDNDNSVQTKAFLRARMLDLLLGDWDRHEDQWRWKNEGSGKEKKYVPIPRDRDQVFRLQQGLFPYLAARSWIMPTLQGFSGHIETVRYAIFKTKFLNALPENQLSREEWANMAQKFTQEVTDEVLESGLKRLPKGIYDIRHDKLLKDLQARRAEIPAAMDEYYRFVNRIIDLRLSDKNELVNITDTPEKGLKVELYKITDEGKVKNKLMEKTYPIDLTKEIRVYLGKGKDSVIINNQTSDITLRIIGGNNRKAFSVLHSTHNIKLYLRKKNAHLYGKTEFLKPKTSSDSSQTAFVPVNLYNVTMPLFDFASNLDDGLMLGGGFKYIHQEGFRTTPFQSSQELKLAHAFSTKAFRLRYQGVWSQAVGKADLLIAAHVQAPHNAQNFFGLGNDTPYDKSLGIRYYRARYNTFQFDPSLRWRYNQRNSLNVGLSTQFYTFETEENEGRFISNSRQINSYDSTTIEKSKAFVGLTMNHIIDNRNNLLLPTSGGYLHTKLLAYQGINAFSKSFAQLSTELAVFKSLDRQGAIVIANRTGGGITLGNTAFYQSHFLGGQGNLLGYRQNRFGGQHFVYNNLEMRVKMAQLGGYILPGQIGLIGFYDLGKVWVKGYNSNTIHQSVGGGLYYFPAQMLTVQLVAGYSKEGWYPYFTTGFRF